MSELKTLCKDEIINYSGESGQVLSLTFEYHVYSLPSPVSFILFVPYCKDYLRVSSRTTPPRISPPKHTASDTELSADLGFVDDLEVMLLLPNPGPQVPDSHSFWETFFNAFQSHQQH